MFARSDTYTEIPTEHMFAPGVYCRKVFMQAGHVYIGKIHGHDHGNIVAQGCVSVFSEFEDTVHRAYSMFVSPKGTKRALYAHEDTIWICVHPNPDNETDLVKLEERYIVPHYAALGWETPDIGRIE